MIPAVNTGAQLGANFVQAKFHQAYNHYRTQYFDPVIRDDLGVDKGGGKLGMDMKRDMQFTGSWISLFSAQNQNGCEECPPKRTDQQAGFQSLCVVGQHNMVISFFDFCA